MVVVVRSRLDQTRSKSRLYQIPKRRRGSWFVISHQPNPNLEMSSSEDENLELLKEAVDNEFFDKRLFDPNASKDIVNNETLQKPSLRYQEEEEKMNDLNVTPEFQKFVASHLMKIIDSQIKEVEIPTKYQSCKEFKGAIRLLGSSLNPVSCEEVETNMSRVKRKKFKRPDRFNDCAIPEQERCVEAAVSAEWILSQQAIDGWEPSTKGKVVVYSASEVQWTKTKQQKQESRRLRMRKLKLKKKAEKLEKETSQKTGCDTNPVL